MCMHVIWVIAVFVSVSGKWNNVKWIPKLQEIVTYSESLYEEARKDVKRHNEFANCVRINPSEDTGIGKIGMENQTLFS